MLVGIAWAPGMTGRHAGNEDRCPSAAAPARYRDVPDTLGKS